MTTCRMSTTTGTRTNKHLCLCRRPGGPVEPGTSDLLLVALPRKREGEGRRLRRPSPYAASKTVSRVLYLTAIYLGAPLPARSSHLLRTAGQASCPPAVLLRIEFTAVRGLPSPGELLPRLSTLTPRAPVGKRQAVFLCCTGPRVAPGGCYPLSLPCGARTFLRPGLSAPARGCLSYSQGLFYKSAGRLSRTVAILRDLAYNKGNA